MGPSYKKRKRASTPLNRRPAEKTPVKGRRAQEERRRGEAAVGRLAATIASDLAKAGGADELLHYWSVGNVKALCKWEPPYECLTVEQTRLARQLQALYQKREDLVIPGIDRRDAALKKFMEAESLCRETNDLFRMRARGQLSLLRGVESILFSASRKIARILGEAPTVEMADGFFGPGATTLTKKKNSHPLIKMEAGLACSGQIASTVADMAGFESNAWVRTLRDSFPDSVPILVEPGIVEIVPKNYATGRVIVKEPPLNGWFQNYIGSVMMPRLRVAGIDLYDQSGQRAAASCAVANGVATLDLSSASDTKARSVVEDLLPGDWFELLSRFRTQEVLLPGQTQPIRLEKFSSMGNGFTFPLESVIFFALAWASTEAVDPELCKWVRVYGDDILLHSSVVPIFRTVLTTCGFVLNMDKSYWDGPFRESCGGDYLWGMDVRPVYLRGEPTRGRLYSLYNGLITRERLEYAQIVLEAIPQRERVFGPAGIGDGVLIDPFYEKVVQHNRHGCEFIAVRAWVPQVKEIRVNNTSPFMLPYALQMCERAARHPYNEVVEAQSWRTVVAREMILGRNPPSKLPYNLRWRAAYSADQLLGWSPVVSSHRYDNNGDFWIKVPGGTRDRIQTIYIAP